MRLALYQPDIAQNTGTMLRLAACLGVAVDVIAPTGFDMTDRALRRAGLDYLAHVEILHHPGFAEFQEARRRSGSRLVLLTTRAGLPYTSFAYEATDTLIVGRESAGVPEAVHQAADASVRIPIRPGLRSLNVAVAAAMALGEALRQTGGFEALQAASSITGDGPV
jgi:tRNA (cytidine/uridine-2'-O-)-methyltransferase